MNRKIGKIIAGIVGIGLIIMLLLFANSLVGNPVSKLLAQNAAQKYIEENYSGLDLEVQRTGYNFKWGEYTSFVQSSTSEDTAFSIYFDSFGGVRRDDYEYEVANNFTTFRRLDEEMREAGKELIGGGLNYDFEYAAFSFSKEEEDLTKLKRDMKLDLHNPPLPLAMDVTLYSADVTYDKIAEVAKALEVLAAEQNIPVSCYSVRIMPSADKPDDENQASSWVNSIAVTDFPAERMNEENLPQVMEQFERDWENELNANDPKN